jgi:hypothetical protein
VDEIVSQRTRKNPRFPALVAEAENRRAPNGTRTPSAARKTVNRLLGSSSTPNVAGL